MSSPEEDGVYIFDSDAGAINVLIREMVTQSIIPFMENRVTAWNDQVASRRRGIGGRFMSISKRWAGFGSSKASNATSGSNGPSATNNFNAQIGFYPPESPEAIMRSLADYAVMLRDWRLAYSSYDSMRSDFSHDKAWNYHAAANEMTAITSLLLPPAQSRVRIDHIAQWLDLATYSYLTRCSFPTKAKRCLVLASELLFDRGPPFSNDAPEWAARLLEISVLGTVEQALVAERIAEYYTVTENSTMVGRRPCKRHAAMWALLASQSWARLERFAQADRQARIAEYAYTKLAKRTKKPPFHSMQPLWDETITKMRDPQVNGMINSKSNSGCLNAPVDIKQEQLSDFVTNAAPDSNCTTSNFANHPSPLDNEAFQTTSLQIDGFEACEDG